ncbi:MAG TPA: NAD(P)-binding domain-containing protein, partial [Aggregatilineales bacterium]|nr:NAD(P)-binding domain-containing protein [Aggregatilineales bacterium]
MTEKIGFIGLGIMGQGMVRNLHKVGFAITVWNRTSAKAEPLRELGITIANSPADVASNSDIII